ncbi:MAG TPA: hypothetical protein VKE69_14460, partial [Planctomycetota bacterium]|nr:hypothetical protein [Planctomycetota bacterium]
MLRLALAASLPLLAQSSSPASRPASAPAASDFVLQPPPIPATGEPDPEIEKEIDELLRIDRAERTSAGAEGAEGLRRLKVNSANRVARLDQLWMEGKLVAPRVRYGAATLYQFGPGMEEIQKGYALARAAAEAGVAESRLLAA